MKLAGDSKGIEVLKKFHENNNEYLKFLLQEAKTNMSNSTTFKDDESGTSYQLSYTPSTGELTVEKL